MATPARISAQRAAEWATGEPAIMAAIVFGSVARDRDTADSDLDLILVTEDAERLWAQRSAIAETILGGPVVATQEPSWQAAHRFQAWTAQGWQLDLTIATGVPAVFGGLAKGFIALVDRAGIADQLRTAIAGWSPPEFDAPAFDTGTWAWLRYLHGRLHRGELLAVRGGVFDTLMYRVIPLLGSQWHSAEAELTAADLARIHAAAPTSAAPAELARSLAETARTYHWALDRWAARTGRDRPRSPLADATLAQLAQRRR